MNITIRKAVQEDCSRLLELVKELAEYEKAPCEVTVTPEHFKESGFGSQPVWWAFVAEIDGIIKGFSPILYPLQHLEGSTDVPGRLCGYG